MVRTGSGRGYVNLTTTEPIGELVEKLRDTGPEFDSQRTTARYRMRVSAAEYLGRHGPVLIIEATKRNAQLFAVALADDLEEEAPEAGPLVALASTRLGENHPLVKTLQRGVGFHHAALPEDVQAELEDAVRLGRLHYLVSTTTLIEGINLPVRSVLIGTTGFQTAEGFVETLDAPKLLNAIGRAGRAGKETEGWIVLSVDERFSPQQFHRLERQDADLGVESRLATEDALAALNVFEDLVRRSEDAVFECAAREVAEFVGHIWFVASAIEELTGAVRGTAVLQSVENTLAWHQLDEATRERWKQVSFRAFASYVASPEERRRRWARTGTSIPTATRLEHLVDEILPAIQQLDNLNDPEAVLAAMTSDGRMNIILGLSESPFRPFRPTRTSPGTVTIPVDVAALTLDWIRGVSLAEIAERHLSDIKDEDFRYEQLSEFATGVLEHLLPWVLATIGEWLSQRLGPDVEPPSPNLAAYVRYGVNTPTGLTLMAGGIRSRRLAHRIAGLAPEGVQVKEWLASMDLPAWRDAFDAGPSELADLIAFTRARDAQVAARVLAGESVSLNLISERDTGAGPLTLRPVDEPPPQRLALWQEDTVIAVVPTALHDDLTQLLATGLPFALDLDRAGDEYEVTIRVIDPDAIHE